MKNLFYDWQYIFIPVFKKTTIEQFLSFCEDPKPDRHNVVIPKKTMISFICLSLPLVFFSFLILTSYVKEHSMNMKLQSVTKKDFLNMWLFIKKNLSCNFFYKGSKTLSHIKYVHSPFCLQVVS